MNVCRYFLCFAVFSFIGWAYETVYYSVQHKKWVNSGFLSTCFCPIYGIGAMLDLLLLGSVKNTFALFAAGMVVTGSLEYFVSWMLERLFGRRWWDYTDWPLNINGRVCILSAAMFGIGTVALIKFIAPFTFGMINRIDIPTRQSFGTSKNSRRCFVRSSTAPWLKKSSMFLKNKKRP